MSPWETINFGTAQGVEIKALLQGRLDEYRKKNDGIELTPLDTAVLRGRIAELHALLAVAPPAVKVASYYDQPTGDRE